MNELMEIGKLFGPSAAVIGFFLWRDFKREQVMSKRINEIEDFVQNQLMELVTTTVAATKDQAASNREVTMALSRRPCLAPERLGRKA